MHVSCAALKEGDTLPFGLEHSIWVDCLRTRDLADTKVEGEGKDYMERKEEFGLKWALKAKPSASAVSTVLGMIKPHKANSSESQMHLELTHVPKLAEKLSQNKMEFTREQLKSYGLNIDDLKEGHFIRDPKDPRNRFEPIASRR